MMLAAGFALFKLLNSFFIVNVDREYGRNLFYRAIRAIRNMSVISNDLPQRLAEVLTQLWKASGEGFKYEDDSDRLRGSVDHNVQLKVRCRMSMSLLYDSVWRWREELQGKVRVESLDKAVKNPTSPEDSAHPGPENGVPGTVSGTLMGPTASALGLTPSGGLSVGYGGVNPPNFAGPNGAGLADSLQFFDAMSWFLDEGPDLGFGGGLGAEVGFR